jgi:hypothetical protein
MPRKRPSTPPWGTFEAALMATRKMPDPYQPVLRRWKGNGHPADPVWDKVATDVAEYGRVDNESIYHLVIDRALGAWRTAQRLDHIQELERKDRDELIELVQMAEGLAKFFGGSKYTGIGAVAIIPLLLQHDMMSLQQLSQLHAREAELLRQLVSDEDKRGRTLPWPPRISRLRGKRKQIAFMLMMVDYMHGLCGKPQYDAVALMTNIHFPDADVTAENVRNACRPTTRRMRKTGALKR